jgi:tetratricopeptide (TPR) repeat protein
MSAREDLPVLPQQHSPRGLGSFLLSCALAGIVGALAEFDGDRHTDITIGIGVYLGLVWLGRIWVWSQTGNAESALRRGNYETALERAERGIAFFKRYEWLDRARGGLLGEMGLTTLTERAHAHKVTALAHLGRMDDAQAAFAEMKAACPDAPSILPMGYFLDSFQRRD